MKKDYKFSTEPISIDIAKILDFGIDDSTFKISFNDQETNKKYYNEFIKIVKQGCQTTVGYRICNVGTTTITNIVVPNFSLNIETGLYEGKEELVNLEPDQFLDLPTRYLIFLLFSHGQTLKINNGEFKQVVGQYDKDIDLLSNFYFKPNLIWDDEYFKEYYSHEIMGGYKIDKDSNYLGYELLPEPAIYRERFGFLMNTIKENKSSNEEITDDIKFLATLLFKKEL